MEEDDLFEQNAAFVQNHLGLFTTDDLLHLYGRYKQVTVGDVNTPRPGMFSFEARKKWDAWNSLKSVSKSKAANEYISKVEHVKQANGLSTAKPSSSGGSMMAPKPSRMMEEDPIDDDDKTIFDLCQEGNLERVEELLDEGFNIDEPDVLGMTLLHWATDRGDENIIRMLARKGANMNIQDGEGQTALHYAASCGHDHLVPLLMELGTDPSISDDDNYIPAQVATSIHLRTMLTAH